MEGKCFFCFFSEIIADSIRQQCCIMSSGIILPERHRPGVYYESALVLLRIFIIWAISSWFRRGPSTPDPNTPAGAPRVPSRNLFPKDTLMVFIIKTFPICILHVEQYKQDIESTT